MITHPDKKKTPAHQCGFHNKYSSTPFTVDSSEEKVEAYLNLLPDVCRDGCCFVVLREMAAAVLWSMLGSAVPKIECRRAIICMHKCWQDWNACSYLHSVSKGSRTGVQHDCFDSHPICCFMTKFDMVSAMQVTGK